MSKQFKDVVEFNQDIIKLAPTEFLNQERVEWFKNTINEELSEFEKANGDYIAAKKCNADAETLLGCQVDMMDAIIDLIYFAFGRLYEIGITEDDFDAMWNAVHESNMTKKRGNKGRGSDDDAIKPEGWQGPEQKFIIYKKSRKAGINTLVKSLQTPTDKNIVNKINDLQRQNTCQCSENGLRIIKDREISLEDYYDEDCTVPSDSKDIDVDDTSLFADLGKETVKPLGACTGRIPVQCELHLPGLKYDEGKPNLSLVFSGFAKALQDVGHVGTFGARKYTPAGWKSVPNLQERYMSALLRHTFAVLDNEPFDCETGRHHLAHVAWNALAMLEDLFNGPITYAAYNKSALAKSEETLRTHFEKTKGQNNE